MSSCTCDIHHCHESKSPATLSPLEKKSLPWIEIATRMTIIALGVNASPSNFFAGALIGAVVGYRTPNAKKIDVTTCTIGCSQKFLDWMAGGEQALPVVFLIATLSFGHHMTDPHAKVQINGIKVVPFVVIGGYMIGQWAARAVYRQYTSLSAEKGK